MIFLMNGSEPALMSHALNGPPHLRPIILAVVTQDICYMGVSQDAGMFRVPRGRPAVLLLGDDLNDARGPSAFRRKSVRDFVQRCALFVIVSSGAEVCPYRVAAETAGLHRKNVVLVETRPEQETAWVEYLRAMNPAMRCLLCTIRPELTLH